MTSTGLGVGALGLEAAETAFKLRDPDARIARLVAEGVWREQGGPVMSVEGLAHTTLPIRTYQYHPEGAPGPRDNEPVFDAFVSAVNAAVSGR